MDSITEILHGIMLRRQDVPVPPKGLGGAGLPDDDLGPKILSITGAISGIALLTFVLRMYVRVKMVHNVGWDDLVMGFTQALCIAGFAVIVAQVESGGGRHRIYLTDAQAQRGLMLNFITQPIFLIAIGTVKISIGLFLMRIAPSKFYRSFLIGIMVFMGIYTIVCFFTLVFQCNDLRVLWEVPVAEPKCFGPKTLQSLSYLNVSLNILTDLVFSALPIPMLWNVQINKRTKISLIAIMGLGIFACAAAFVKTSKISNYGKMADFLWDASELTIWVVLECNVGMIAGNLPCLKPLFKRLLDRSMYSSKGRSKSGNLYYAKGTNVSRHTHKGSQHMSGFPEPAHMMTDITAKKQTRSTVHSIDDGSSEEGILPLQTNAFGAGIMRTTEVQVRSDEKAETGKKNGLPAPKREVEDRV